MDRKHYNDPRQRSKVPQAIPDEEVYDNIDIELPEYEKSHAKISQRGGQRNGGSVQISRPKKQPKKKLSLSVIIGAIAVLVITVVLIALVFLTTFVLTAVQVQLLKDTQGTMKRQILACMN